MRIERTTKIISSLMIFAVHLCAQVNTEKYRTPADFRGWAGYIEISGIIKSGNTAKTEGALDGRLDWRTENTTTFFVFKSDHEWVDGKRVSNEGLLHIRNSVMLRQNISLEIFGQINYDKKILVDDRELAGLGIRYRILRFSQSDIYLGSAYMFEHEKYDLPGSSVHPTETSVSRWSNHLSLYLQITSYAQLTGVIYYQPDFNDLSDIRVLNESNLTIDFTQLLSLSLNFQIRYDSDPPERIEKTDMKTDFGIAFRF